MDPIRARTEAAGGGIRRMTLAPIGNRLLTEAPGGGTALLLALQMSFAVRERWSRAQRSRVVRYGVSRLPEGAT